ncbi:MAG: hypothetical protein U9R24_00965 [Thermodesulfobacteriota bacterium]|nr:hypothetical protein [Thermodesulfobacteriota bacterium]
MKKIGIMMIVALVTGGLVFADSAMAGRIGKRQFNQQKRICQGIKSGELSRPEVRTLERKQRRIQRHKRIAWSDGTLTRKERICLDKHQDSASRRIGRMKNNDFKR